MRARLASFAWIALLLAVPWVALETAYDLGYYRGYHRGFSKIASYTLCLIEHGNADSGAYAECKRAEALS